MARLRELSADLRRTLYTPEAYACMPRWARQWSDGGCRTLQRAVVLWLGDAAEPWGMFWTPEACWREDMGTTNAYHVGCVVDGRFWLDGEGLCRLDDVRGSFGKGLWPWGLELRPMPDPDAEEGYVEDPSTVKADTLPDLVALLAAGLGTREAFLASLPRG